MERMSRHCSTTYCTGDGGVITVREREVMPTPEDKAIFAREDEDGELCVDDQDCPPVWTSTLTLKPASNTP